MMKIYQAHVMVIMVVVIVIIVIFSSLFHHYCDFWYSVDYDVQYYVYKWLQQFLLCITGLEKDWVIFKCYFYLLFVIVCTVFIMLFALFLCVQRLVVLVLVFGTYFMRSGNFTYFHISLHHHRYYELFKYLEPLWLSVILNAHYYYYYLM